MGGVTSMVTSLSNRLPGTTATVLSARKTRNVRSAERFPSGNAIVMYLTHGHKHSHVMTVTHCVKFTRHQSVFHVTPVRRVSTLAVNMYSHEATKKIS